MTIFNAIRQGNLERVRELIEEDPMIVNATEEGQCTPLHLAAVMGHKAVVEYLLEQGANIEAKNILDTTPLHWAAIQGHTAVVEYLLKRRGR